MLKHYNSDTRNVHLEKFIMAGSPPSRVSALLLSLGYLSLETIAD